VSGTGTVAKLLRDENNPSSADLMAYLVADFSARATHYFALDMAAQMAANMSSGGQSDVSAGFSSEASVCFETGVRMDIGGYFMAGLDGDHAGQVE
jgi:hypothetical protein